MDNKEAAEILKAWSTDEYPLALLMEAVDLAIKALEQEQNVTHEEIYQEFIHLEAENERLHDKLEVLSQKPCEDMVTDGTTLEEVIETLQVWIATADDE